MRQTWTDDRLDEFGRRIDERFDRVDEKFNEVDKRFEQVDKRFEQVDKRFEQVDKRFEQVDKRFDRVEESIEGLRVELNEHNRQRQSEFNSFQRMMFQFYGVFIAALIGLLATQLY